MISLKKMDKEKEKVFERYIQQRRLRIHTRAIKDIQYYLTQFLNFSKKPIKDYDEKILLDFLEKISKKYKTQTLNKIKISILKNFIKYYFDDWSLRFRHLDEICKTEKFGQTYDSDDVITEEDLKKMIKSEESHFWKAYFLILFYGGSRPSEVCKLEWSQVEFDIEGTYISISVDKNKKTFLKYLPDDASFYLKELKKDSKSNFVFYNPLTKSHISEKGAYFHVRKLSQKVLSKKISLYILRHSIATLLYNKENLKDDDVAKQMGHSKSMKSVYVHNDKTKLKEIAKRIYFTPEDMPEEKKHELEIKIKEQEEKIKTIEAERAKEKENLGKLIDQINRILELKQLSRISI